MRRMFLLLLLIIYSQKLLRKSERICDVTKSPDRSPTIKTSPLVMVSALLSEATSGPLCFCPLWTRAASRLESSALSDQSLTFNKEQIEALLQKVANRGQLNWSS